MRTTSCRDERPPTPTRRGTTIHSRHVQPVVRDNLITAKMTAKKQRVAAEESAPAHQCKMIRNPCIAATRGRDAAKGLSNAHCTRAGDADAMQYARAASRRRAAAIPSSNGTHKRTTCGARMQRDMPPPRPLRNTLGAARGRPKAKSHTTAAEKRRTKLTQQRTGASSSSRPSP